ncbi:MAG: NAD-dependent epimerase/dehydratase family protein [Promethearchaeota archaeon]|jgi:predicted dehydrogenase/nucleoside-diphosphate-sugar epimerase
MHDKQNESEFNKLELTKKKLDVAVFGLGKMGVNHLRCIKNLDMVGSVSVADPKVSKEKIAEFAEMDLKMFKNPEELLKSKSPDIVHIVTPPETHYELTKLAINNSAHVFVEKPFVQEHKEAENLFDLAGTKNVNLCAGHQLLFQRAVKSAGKFIDNIGEIVHIDSYFSFRMVRRSISRVDQLIDILPHPVYVLLHLLGINLEKHHYKNLELLISDTDVSGEVRALFKYYGRTAFMNISLNCRPVDSYLKVIGTHGTVYLDFVRDIVIDQIGPGADAISAIIQPYKHSIQSVIRSSGSFINMAFHKVKTYPGLYELISEFYQNVLINNGSPITSESIKACVKVCEQISENLLEKHSLFENEAKQKLLELSKNYIKIDDQKGIILVTGGTGFLGQEVVKTLRNRGYRIRVICRNLPDYSRRVPDVEYVKADLAEELSDNFFTQISLVIHCAAETSGGFEEHERNSIFATKNLIAHSKKAGIKKFIYISSIAVLKPGQFLGKPLHENSSVDYNNMNRGPYVWGKAMAEEVVNESIRNNGIQFKILRPGPLVAYNDFDPPGRLGRSVGARFIVMGSKESRISVCDVSQAAELIQYVVDNFESTPPIINLIEPSSSKRKDLIKRLVDKSPGISPLYIPSILVSVISTLFKILQKIKSPGKKAIDIKAAFSSEKYDSTLANQMINKSKSLNR